MQQQINISTGGVTANQIFVQNMDVNFSYYNLSMKLKLSQPMPSGAEFIQTNQEACNSKNASCLVQADFVWRPQISDSGKNVSFCVYAMDNATNFSVGIGCMRGNASASTTSFTIFVEKCKYCTQPGDTLEKVIGGLLCARQGAF
mmetsp:Transcript_52678/g.163469  ORF Transcript_52678/g.163469 Transcript_52678/m.163469 type:complete len:145 (-) Transcript_52678:330-764(-)